MELEIHKDEKPKRKRTDIQQVIMAWKLLHEIPEDNKAWDRHAFKTYGGVAKIMPGFASKETGVQ